MNLICINCNDMFRWNIITANLPSNITNYKLLVVTDKRLGDKLEAIKAMYPYAEVVEVQTILDKYRNEISSKDNVSRLALAMKMIEPWYIHEVYKPEKFIILDDDIIINEKIDDLFENCSVNAMFRLGYDSIAKNDSLATRLKKLSFAVCGISFNERIRHVNGGHLIFSNELDFDEYIDIASTYLDSKIMTEVINNQKNWKSYYVDEVFFSALYHMYSTEYKDVYETSKYIKCHQIIPEKTNFLYFNKSMPKYGVVHFTVTNKKLTYNTLIELGYLKTRGEYPCY